MYKIGKYLSILGKRKPQRRGISAGIKPDFCKSLSRSIDLLGYSQEMIRFRIETNKFLDEIHNAKPFSCIHVTTGGKAEGTALYFESDIDRLYAVKEVGCVEPGMECSQGTILHLVRTDCSPGYTRLKLEKLCDTDSGIKNYLVEKEGKSYVSNSYSLFRNNSTLIDINGIRIKKQNKSGPSAPFGNKFIKYDFVFAFGCHCPTLSEKWTKRPRQHNWPDSELIKHISTLDAHVVPVANKGSLFRNTEWRICFTKAELILMHSFTEMQTKLYILLKLIAKSVLKPLCSEITSYIIKNIVFWIVENNPKELFQEIFLIDRLMDALEHLKDCISSNTLESYMISDRNLFEGRLTEKERDSLLTLLEVLLSEKENLLQRCSKIHIAMNKLKESPEEFSKEAENRDQIEKLVYGKNIIFKRYDRPGQSVEEFRKHLNLNEDCINYDNELRRLVIPDLLAKKQDQNFDEIYRERLSRILS